MQIKGRLAVITGASSGIGEALAHEFSRAGMTCVLLARRADELQRVADAVESACGRRPITAVCDVTDPVSLRRATADLRETLDHGLHLLVLNAGMTMHGRFDASTTDALRRIMELNFFGAVETVRAFLPFLKKADAEKKIVLISTPSGLYGISERFGYSASKAAAQAFVESIAHELRDDAITTAIFYPGYVATSLRTSGIGADGRPIQEEQASNAKTPEAVARIFRKAIESDRRRVFTNFTGRFIYLARVLAPGLLDWLIRKKH
ncbi:MAG: SDR family NAD(P)-dependent oxidoreductase [Leptonema illini]|uniref:SDR family NAD(P)-dependent oxidoreductase n=1 Tax=Leptonema illini TaxID=183 RepID=A0A833LW87_9LEPT|nr:MAG: SDR family NAD(P)-dependent oxidoreductase [Leptonema illini]